VGVGPVVQARQAIFADGDSAGAAVARQHQSARHIGHPRACALEVFARKPWDRSCYQAWVGLGEHAERCVTTAISREQLIVQDKSGSISTYMGDALFESQKRDLCYMLCSSA
jgi:hypothetical protein